MQPEALERFWLRPHRLIPIPGAVAWLFLRGQRLHCGDALISSFTPTRAGEPTRTQQRTGTRQTKPPYPRMRGGSGGGLAACAPCKKSTCQIFPWNSNGANWRSKEKKKRRDRKSSIHKRNQSRAVVPYLFSLFSSLSFSFLKSGTRMLRVAQLKWRQLGSPGEVKRGLREPNSQMGEPDANWITPENESE